MKWIFVLLALGLVGCSHSLIVKECKQVQGEDGMFVCQSMKPWN